MMSADKDAQPLQSNLYPMQDFEQVQRSKGFFEEHTLHLDMERLLYNVLKQKSKINQKLKRIIKINEKPQEKLIYKYKIEREVQPPNTDGIRNFVIPL